MPLRPYATSWEVIETKEYFIGVRLSEPEYDRLMVMCDKSCCNVSTVIRSLIRDGIIKERPSRDYRELSRAIDRIGNNYNQLVHRANMTGKLFKEDLKESEALLHSIRTEIESWKEQWL